MTKGLTAAWWALRIGLGLGPAGNQKALAELKITKKTDHLRATVVGERSGETIKVTSISLE